MSWTDSFHPPLDQAFGAVKKAVANALGIKRLEDGYDFYDGADSMVSTAGERNYNMGDLWQEPLSDMPHAEEHYLLSDISDLRPESD